MPHSMKNIDHFMIAANDLSRLEALFTTVSGIAAADGGSHPDQGTHNKLVATSSRQYIELIAPDPARQVDNALRASMTDIQAPRLHRIIGLANQSQFPTIIEAYRRAGVSGIIKPASREKPSGEVLRWTLLVPDQGNPYGVFAPLFIDWGNTTHPSQSLPPAPCSIVNCHATHPQSQHIRALWDDIGFDFPVEQAAEARITLSLDTPRGLVDFES